MFNSLDNSETYVPSLWLFIASRIFFVNSLFCLLAIIVRMNKNFISLFVFITVHMNRKKYQRLSYEEKELLRKLTIEGKSLNKISQITGLGKTTIYYHVKDLKPRQWRKLIVDLNDNRIGELMGAFAGDGSYYYSRHKKSGGGRHIIRYSLSISKDREYAKHLKYLLIRLNLNPFLCYGKYTNSMEVRVHSKEYLKLIKKYLVWEDKRTYSIRLKNKLESYSEDFIKGFVRGVMDTDGFVEPYNVSCGCTSEKLILNLAEIYDKFKIIYKLTRKKRMPERKDLFLIRVKKESLIDYFNLFGFSNKYKLDSLKKCLKRHGARRI